jgi:hypothetical protein
MVHGGSKGIGSSRPCPRKERRSTEIRRTIARRSYRGWIPRAGGGAFGPHPPSATGISRLTAVLAGLAPALTVLRTDVNTTLTDEGRGGSGVLGGTST